MIPYWREAAKVADANNVKICVEPIAGNTVYNPETLHRLLGDGRAGDGSRRGRRLIRSM